jgi:hypothetical protein
MATHTPGPWALHPDRAYVIPAEHLNRPIGGADDLEVDLQRYAQEICAMHWPDPHRPAQEMRANARLIAAAPDMLNALKAALPILMVSDDGIPRATERLHLVEAAICLAETGRRV